MNNLIKAGSSACRKCKYWYKSSECCGYVFETEQCRTYRMGKRLVPKGMCDRFEPRPKKAEVRRGAKINGII